MKDHYIYPAIFDYADDGISMEFPDLPGCLPCATTTTEANKNAKEALALHLHGMEKDGDDIPEPTDIRHIKHEQNQVVVLIEVWMPLYRKAIEGYAVKKTLTIPKWLDEAANQADVNFSHILQQALKEHLGLNDTRP